MDNKYFAEGATYARIGSEDLIYQLTWRENEVLIWDADDLTLRETK